MTWSHHYQMTLRARHIPVCLNVMADFLSTPVSRMVTASADVQTDLSKWFTPHVDLFVTHLNHKVSLYVSPVPYQNAWDIDALNINWSGLTAYAYPPMALLHRVIQKIRQYNCLIIVVTPRWPGMPWFWDIVQLSTEIPLHLPVSTTLLKQSHNCFSQQSTSQPPSLVSRCGQLQEQGFSVEVAEKIAVPQRSATSTI